MASNTAISAALGDGQHGILAASQAAEAQDAGLGGVSASRRLLHGGGLTWFNDPELGIYGQYMIK
jgi:hypothetical protein